MVRTINRLTSRVGFTRIRKKLPILIIVTILLLIPLAVRNNWILHILIIAFFWGILGESLNILAGYAGQLSFGQSIPFGLGAYSSMLLLLNYNLSPWIGMLVGCLIAMAVGVLIGFPCFRLKGPYFVFSTFALAEILAVIFTVFREQTGGALGLSKPAGDISLLYFQFHPLKAPYYYIILTMMLLVIYITYSLDKSKIGYELRAVREDENAAAAIGINPFRRKMQAALVSSFIAGLMGTFYISYINFIDPISAFGLGVNVQILLVMVIGGTGSPLGPIIGSVILVPLQFLITMYSGAIASAGTYELIMGILLIFFMLVRPQGLLPLIKRLYGSLSEGVKKIE